MSDELRPDEPHPAFGSARQWLEANTSFEDRLRWLEAFSSTAIEGNRLAEVCAGTLDRIMKGEPVGERYVLGLVWTLRAMRDKDALKVALKSQAAHQELINQWKDVFRRLVLKLIAVTPALKYVFEFAQNHGIKYDGPTYEAELAEARALLRLDEEEDENGEPMTDEERKLISDATGSAAD